MTCDTFPTTRILTYPYVVEEITVCSISYIYLSPKILYRDETNRERIDSLLSRSWIYVEGGIRCVNGLLVSVCEREEVYLILTKTMDM